MSKEINVGEIKSFIGVVYKSKAEVFLDDISEVWTSTNAAETEGTSDYILVKDTQIIQEHCINGNVFCVVQLSGICITDFVLA